MILYKTDQSLVSVVRVLRTMNFRRIRLMGLSLTAGIALAFTLSQPVWGHGSEPAQDEPAQPKPKVATGVQGGASIQAIDEEYNRRLLELEKQRLEKLAQLAARQPPKESLETYELLFRLAIANNLFREAEPIAQQVKKSGMASAPVSFLAHTVDIIASADRGNFEESLAELKSVIAAQSQTARPDQARRRRSTLGRSSRSARHTTSACCTATNLRSREAPFNWSSNNQTTLLSKVTAPPG